MDEWSVFRVSLLSWDKRCSYLRGLVDERCRYLQNQWMNRPSCGAQYVERYRYTWRRVPSWSYVLVTDIDANDGYRCWWLLLMLRVMATASRYNTLSQKYKNSANAQNHLWRSLHTRYLGSTASDVIDVSGKKNFQYSKETSRKSKYDSIESERT